MHPTERTKAAESALLAHGKTQKGLKTNKRKSKPKSNPDEHCENCNRDRHLKVDCWSKGGGKEGQGPKQKKSKGNDKGPEVAAVAESKPDDDELFVFTCTLHLLLMATGPCISGTSLRVYIDSGATSHYCPDKSKFITYKPITGRNIVAADGHMLKALGIGDIRIELPNSLSNTHALLKEAVHAPEMAFMLISISKLNQAKCTVMFNNGICTISNLSGKIMAKILCSDGLYRLALAEPAKLIDHVNVALVKMDINKAHRKLGHIAHAAIRHAISTGRITSIQVDSTSKVEFCEPCAKAKCWGFVISILIGSTGMELKAKNISKKSLSYQKTVSILVSISF